jgi:nitrite reductase/ring-hydroxylating ferredoxin subunit
VAASADVPPDGVLPVRAFGRELVLFRTRRGLAAVDAYCPHAGAHLGHGGTVEGESLRCPFHGLRYGLDGRCLEDGRERARLTSWPVESWQGQLMVFASPDGRAPDWRLPALDGDGWGAPLWRTLRLRGHVQDVAENGVDFRHFVEVHRYSNLREPLVEVDGLRLHSRFGFDRRNPLWARLGPVRAVFDTDIWGLGCSITSLTVSPLDLRFRLLLLATQVDDAGFEFTIGLCMPRLVPRPLSDVAGRWMMRTIVGDVLQDERIWAHRRQLERPAHMPEDAPLVTFQKYARRFYD